MKTRTRPKPTQTHSTAQRQSMLDKAIENAVSFLLKSQTPDGYWVGELEGDTILESEYIILMHFLGRRDNSKLNKAAQFILTKQSNSGGWTLFPGGPTDVSASVKAYLALKLTIATGDEPYMVKAREAINASGGLPAVNSYTRFYLAMLGQIRWTDAPAVPPEIMLLPNWFYFNIYEISSWSRTFVVPLSIIWSHKRTIHLSNQNGLRDLLNGYDLACMRLHRSGRFLSWENFFLAVDSFIKIAERFNITPFRKLAVKKAEKWMLEHLEHSDGLGAIFPPIVYSLIAFKALGYEDTHPQVRRAMQELRRLEIEERHTMHIQPCTSPVWDTAIAINALSEAEIDPDHPTLKRAARWMLSKEIRLRGDWSIKRPKLHPGGWYFEFANEFYPDIDDTAMVLMALEKVGDVQGKREACYRGLEWLLGMQGKDGGWASFDVDNNRQMFNYIPFADHNAMLDPSTSDITARILEMLAFYGYDKDDEMCRKAINFLRTQQEPEGAWYGRWGVNYIYGTWQVLRGLTQIGLHQNDAIIQNGAYWLQSVQNPDGGWGECCITYWQPAMKGKGDSTPSQTAWAIMGLMCAGLTASDEVKFGIQYLSRTQKPDGTWDEAPFTGAGFPKVFFLKYHLYKHSFPLMALGMYRRLTTQ